MPFLIPISTCDFSCSSDCLCTALPVTSLAPYENAPIPLGLRWQFHAFDLSRLFLSHPSSLLTYISELRSLLDTFLTNSPLIKCVLMSDVWFLKDPFCWQFTLMVAMSENSGNIFKTSGIFCLNPRVDVCFFCFYIWWSLINLLTK